jgi:hypothetical protein
MKGTLRIAQLPRQPFLPHSELLANYLLSHVPATCQQILEMGCGPQSPLYPILSRTFTAAQIHQMDAQREVVEAAARTNTRGNVYQLLATDMSAIPSQSIQLVVAMSVFDQNPTAALAQIAHEVSRILVPNGLIMYIHNEELNLPATANSLLQTTYGARILIPSDRWEPTNDYEYASAPKDRIDQICRQIPEKCGPLLEYLQAIYPQVYGTRASTSHEGRIDVPFLRNCNYPILSRIRQVVSALRNEYAVPMLDHQTSDLLVHHVRRNLFCESHGFEVLKSDLFEIRLCVDWRTCFPEPPTERFCTRGIARLGYLAEEDPAANPLCSQELNTRPQPSSEELTLIAYQYGLLARNRGN